MGRNQGAARRHLNKGQLHISSMERSVGFIIDATSIQSQIHSIFENTQIGMPYKQLLFSSICITSLLCLLVFCNLIVMAMSSSASSSVSSGAKALAPTGSTEENKKFGLLSKWAVNKKLHVPRHSENGRTDHS